MSIEQNKLNLIQKIILGMFQVLNGLMSQIIIIVHHSATARDLTTVAGIDNGNRNRGYNKSSLGFYCAYDYVIEGDGAITQTRKELEPDYHTSAYNGLSIGICLTGNFGIEQSSEAQRIALRGLLDKIQGRYGMQKTNIKVHKDFYATECCGRNLIQWVKNYKKGLT